MVRCTLTSHRSTEARYRRLRGVHLVEHRARLAHLRLRFEVANEECRALRLVDKELKSGRIHSRGRSVLLDSGDDLEISPGSRR